MVNEVSNPDLSLLRNLLKTLYQNQEINLILQQNLDKINNDFACLLKKWAIEQFNDRPDTAIKLAKIIFQFSNILQTFEQGNRDINLEIAITGYEVSLQVLTYDKFPNDWANIRQGLCEAYQERQQLLSNTVVNLQEEIDKHQSELKQTQLQVKDITTTLTELKQESVNLLQSEEIKKLRDDYQELKESQSIVHQLLINKDYALFTKRNFNTAIFYDIENLTIGGSDCNLNFSFRLIQDNLRKIDIVQEASVQCAYADWSDIRLKFLRKEIQELGIEAIQIFDFGYRKNAADIQLAIDAMELVNLRPNLEVFVIVSGDGAFASLAKKLHEYGKMVIGCAYEGKSNRFFKSVCDYFIPLIPIQKTLSETVNNKEENPIQYYTNENKNSYIFIDIYNETKEKLLTLKNDYKLIQSGIPLSQIHKFLIDNIPNFNERRLKENSNQLTKFLRKSIEGTELSISSDNNKLILRESLLFSSESLNTIM
ncbi:NYN domain-containing protein [Nostoc sp. FACHB-87]|uniref:NYN domain-containing protein n=1 Tax=Nostocaceae TaxID=1162 RepID=UPI001681EF91|nr:MULTISPECIES: NYN domain-containing protein [Nostocaceae]MBD2458148.1 NYN domain-containing protein [Nostoc sp. FACHB-87]MBD2478969.1 NYN domain-containing protein [Anabaena sp. FACHB-83]